MATNDVELSNETRDTFERHNLRPLWEIEKDELGKSRDDLEAEIWKWGDIQSALDSLDEDVPPGFDRRVTVPVNASFNSAVSHTLFLGIHTAPPGEEPLAHRHGGNALRFVIDGTSQSVSTIGGEDFPMNDGDLLTIPQWEWHGHENESQDGVVWLDVHDTPLLFDALNVGNLFEPSDDEGQLPEAPMGYHRAQYGNVRIPNGTDEIPGPFEGVREPTPPHRFEWTDVSTTLNLAEKGDANEHDPYDGFVVEYTNPGKATGPLFPTYGVLAQRLTSTEPTRSHSHNSTEIYHVIDGGGNTIVNGETISWSNRDIFVIPPNQPHYHEADERSTLLKITDRPLLEAINFYYEVDQEKHQVSVD